MKRRRLHRPLWLERDIIERQYGLCACGRCEEQLRFDIQFNHKPPLALRTFDKRVDDYDPAENDPDYLFAEIAEHHRIGTSHPLGPHTTLNSDQHAITKVRHLQNAHKKKRASWPKGPSRWPKGRKLQSRPMRRSPS